MAEDVCLSLSPSTKALFGSQGERIGVKRDHIPTHKVVICSPPKRNDQ